MNSIVCKTAKCEFSELVIFSSLSIEVSWQPWLIQGFAKVGSLRFIAAKNLAKLKSDVQFLALMFPQFWANWLNLWASGKPISRIARTILFSRRPSNFLSTERMLLANVKLRTFSAITFIVKSISALSILCKALNHTPARMAFILSFNNCRLTTKSEVGLEVEISRTNIKHLFLRYALDGASGFNKVIAFQTIKYLR